MGASDLTTETPQAGNGDAVDDGRSSRANGANGHAAKKRKKQKALPAVAANGHVVKSNPAAGNRAKADKAEHANGNGAKAKKAADANGNGRAKAPAVKGAVVTDDSGAEEAEDEEAEGVAEVALAGEAAAAVEVEHAGAVAGIENLPTVEEVDDVEGHRDVGLVEEFEDLDAEEDPVATPPADGGRRSRRRAAKHAKDAAPKVGRRAAKRAAAAHAEPKLGRRAAKRAEVALRNTPAARRNELVATAAWVAAAAAEAQDAAEKRKPKLIGRIARFVVVLLAIFMIPAAVYALVVTQGPVTTLTHEDAVYMSEQLVMADQRVRKQLVRLRPMRTSPAIARTRESTLTARSLALELGNQGGREAAALQRALRLEASWLDAVGSVLANPRSPLRDRLVSRDAALRPALLALASTEGLRRKGGSQNLHDFSVSRTRARK